MSMGAHEMDMGWHRAINREMDRRREEEAEGVFSRMRFMYEAKTAWRELPRLARLFKAEREDALRKIHVQCSHSDPEPVPDNHLTCCLGKRCSTCPFLMALDKADLTDEMRDEAKAWTCVTHIIQSGGDVAGEGYLLTVDDRMFWDRVYSNLAQAGSLEHTGGDHGAG